MVQLLTSVVEMQKAQMEMMSQWLKLFVPIGSNQSTSFEDRDTEKMVKNIPDEWDPMTPEELEQLFKGNDDGH